MWGLRILTFFSDALCSWMARFPRVLSVFVSASPHPFVTVRALFLCPPPPQYTHFYRGILMHDHLHPCVSLACHSPRSLHFGGNSPFIGHYSCSTHHLYLLLHRFCDPQLGLGLGLLICSAFIGIASWRSTRSRGTDTPNSRELE